MLRDLTQNTPVSEYTSMLANAPFTFHLGGSYFFGCATEQSDLDFITAESDAVIAWLEEHGFVRMGGPADQYDIPETRTRGVYQNGRVQVQVVWNLQATLIARDVLAKYFPAEHKAAKRDTRRQVWTRLIEAVSDVETDFVFALSFPDVT